VRRRGRAPVRTRSGAPATRRWWRSSSTPALTPRAETHTGWTPLHAAAQPADGGGEVVTLLLDRGARVDARDALGWTPLHYAARFDAVDVTRVLLARGAPVDARTALPRKVPSTVYPAGATPLDVARASGSSRAGELLSR
jgi:ankyrin repeat protein